jgi:ADP-heptose:LPS heptosyltransferase
LAQPSDLVGELANDREWIAPDIRQKYPFLKSGHISEIFCRLAYLQGDTPTYRVATEEPGLEVPDVLIATAASLAGKLWPLEKWRETIYWLKDEGYSVGVLGAKASDQKKFWKGDSVEDVLVGENLVQDLRGRLTLAQVVGALAKARAVLTIDNGILHLACATKTPVVGLFRPGIHRLWAPPSQSLSVLIPEEDANVADIPLETVKEALRCALAES